MRVQDIYVTKNDMNPFWIFRDMFDGKHVGGKFLCFINAHFPEEMVSQLDAVNARGAAKLKDGSWKVEMLKSLGTDAKVGWGAGTSPDDAFRKACYNSGYLKVKDVS